MPDGICGKSAAMEKREPHRILGVTHAQLCAGKFCGAVIDTNENIGYNIGKR